ncbi:MAG: agmatine deiminase family protein [Bacteroidales bacterium]|nr:agmatine deiminase family protein [Bacteroidales bacterium]
MEHYLEKKRPSNKALVKEFLEKTLCKIPPKSKIYKKNVKSHVRAIAEFEEMGGVLIAYPGTISRRKEHIQLPPFGPRSFGIPNELIIRMQQADTKKPVHIFIMCANTSEKANIVKDLEVTAQEINAAATKKEEKVTFDANLIHLVPWDTDSYWTRDYGPWWIYNNKTGHYGIAKHLYTSLGGGSVGLVEGAEDVNPREGSGIFRPNDDYGADKFADYLNEPIRKRNKAKWSNGKANPSELPHIKSNNWFNTGLLEVGGNYMVNGAGVIASSYLVATQNELPSAKEEELTHPSRVTIHKRMEYILDQFHRFMGIHKYHVLTDPSGTYIGHIDCWGKFLSEKKVLIAKSQDPQINKAYDYIAKTFADDGFTPYRVMCPNRYVPVASEPATTAAYTNSLILNNYVYVPICGKGYEKYDNDAIQVYKNALPGYTVVPIKEKPSHPWLGTDAMHCRTRAIPREVIQRWLDSQNPKIELVQREPVLMN